MTPKHGIRRWTRAAAVGCVALVTMIVASCSSDAPTTAPGATASNNLLGDLVGTTTQLVGNLLVCRPLPFDSDSAAIGPAGGALQMGPHTLIIPRGALSST